MRKVLIVETNVQNYQGTDEATGLWLGETIEFVNEIQKYGIDVDYVSPKGGYVPIDPRSMKYVDKEIMDTYRHQQFIINGLSNTKKPIDINPKDYVAIYYTGGHGVMWDFPDNQELQKIASEIYANNGYILSVCHGIAGLFNILDEDGNYVISGKKITGFTTSEEILSGMKRKVPFLNQKVAEQRKATFVKKRFYKEFALKDGHIITGQNPFSVKAVAELFLKEVNN